MACKGEPSLPESETSDEKCERLLNSLLTSYISGECLPSQSAFDSSLVGLSSKQLDTGKGSHATPTLHSLDGRDGDENRLLSPLGLLDDLSAGLQSTNYRDDEDSNSSLAQSALDLIFNADPSLLLEEDAALDDEWQSVNQPDERRPIHSSSSVSPVSLSCASESGPTSPVFTSSLETELSDDQLSPASDDLQVEASVTELFPDLI